MAYRFIYFDTETTGIRPKSDRIIEIAAFDPLRKIEKSWFINPGIPIPKEASAIHNITDEMVSDAPPFGIVGKEFIDFLDGDVALVAHNNHAFDQPFLQAEFERANVCLPSFIYIDSLKWARKYRKDLPKHTLQYLREIYGIQANQAHRALDDVIVLYEVFSRMINDLPCETVISLLSDSTNNVKTMPFGKHQGKPLKDVPKDYIQWLAKTGAFDKDQNKELKQELEKLTLL